MRSETALSTERMHVPCCIAGGGPAGMMLGFLLARAGVEVVVLEKHKMNGGGNHSSGLPALGLGLRL